MAGTMAAGGQAGGPRPAPGRASRLRPASWLHGPFRYLGLPVVLASVFALMAAGACREASWFEEVGKASGLDFRYHSGAQGDLLMPEIMGGGVGLLDLDADGDLDVYLPDGHGELPGFGDRAGDGPGSDRLFLQEEGAFRDASADMGLVERGYSMGVAAGDIDNDGLPDLYITNVGQDRLLRNLGAGRFADITADAGIVDEGWSVSAAFCDVDGDGLLDLYVARYLDFDPEQRCQNMAGQPEYCGPKSYRPLSDRLYRNLGDRRFADRSQASGVAGVAAAGLGVVCADLDGDGSQDFYVANDGDANLLWINDGKGVFRDRAVAWGAAFDLRGRAQAGMGLVLADLNGDLRDDLLVTNLRDEVNSLYLAQDEGFLDQTAASGLGPPSMLLTGFGVTAGDLDLDGQVDIAVANGRVRRDVALPGSAMPAPWDRLAEPGSLYLGLGAGQYHPADAATCGPFCADQDLGRGLVSGDVDGDGDLDLIRGGIEGPLRLYRNEAPRRGGWLILRLVDERYRRDAIGATVTLRTADGRRWRRTLSGGGSYGSAGPMDLHFGLGDSAAGLEAEVAWPDGLRERFALRCQDCRLSLQRGSGRQLP